MNTNSSVHHVANLSISSWVKLPSGTWATTLRITNEDNTTFSVDLYAAKPIDIELLPRQRWQWHDHAPATEDQS